MILGLAWYYNVLATLFGFLAIFLMMVILLQRGKGVGLAGAFGGAGGQTAFGSKTGDVLTWATVVIAFLFLVFAVGLNYLFAPISGGLGGPAPVVAPATTPPVTQTPAPATPAQPAPFNPQPAANPSGSGTGGEQPSGEAPAETTPPTEDPPGENP